MERTGYTCAWNGRISAQVPDRLKGTGARMSTSLTRVLRPFASILTSKVGHGTLPDAGPQEFEWTDRRAGGGALESLLDQSRCPRSY